MIRVDESVGWPSAIYPSWGCRLEKRREKGLPTPTDYNKYQAATKIQARLWEVCLQTVGKNTPNPLVNNVDIKFPILIVILGTRFLTQIAVMSCWRVHEIGMPRHPVISVTMDVEVCRSRQFEEPWLLKLSANCDNSR